MAYYENEEVSVLIGKTLKSIEVFKNKKISFSKWERDEVDSIEIESDDGTKYRMTYVPDCCASCNIEEIHGDLQDLVGSPILVAEEATNKNTDDDKDESETWTFYKLATIKGNVTIRWYGSSNGYYSEEASFHRVLEAV